MDTNGVYIDRWYVIIIFSCFKKRELCRCISMGCSTVEKATDFNRQSLKAVVRSRVVLAVFKREKK